MGSKEVLADDILPSGTWVPKGSMIMYSPYLQGRIAWENAGEFRPERWINAEGQFERVSQYKYTVFNAGFRLCLGMDMALLEIKTMVALLMKGYSFSKVPGQTVTYAISLTCPVKDGLQMAFQKIG